MIFRLGILRYHIADVHAGEGLTQSYSNRKNDGFFFFFEKKMVKNV